MAKMSKLEKIAIIALFGASVLGIESILCNKMPKDSGNKAQQEGEEIAEEVASLKQGESLPEITGTLIKLDEENEYGRSLMIEGSDGNFYFISTKDATRWKGMLKPYSYDKVKFHGKLGGQYDEHSPIPNSAGELRQPIRVTFVDYLDRIAPKEIEIPSLNANVPGFGSFDYRTGIMVDDSHGPLKGWTYTVPDKRTKIEDIVKKFNEESSMLQKGLPEITAQNILVEERKGRLGVADYGPRLRKNQTVYITFFGR